MSVIQRPGKEGNATTYQGKVVAGYTKILAAEVDADLDTIFSAWNAGVDTVNIKDAAVTTPKLAAGAVTGGAIGAGAIQTAHLADGAVTTPKLADGAVTDTKIASIPYSKLTGGQASFDPRGLLLAEATGFDIQANSPGAPSYDNTRPSYLIRLDYSGDSLDVFRAPPPGTAFVRIFQVAGTGLTYATLAAGLVGRTQLAVNAVQGNTAGVANPATFMLSTPNVWTNYAILPALTTRGATVHLYAAPAVSVTVPSPGGNVGSRWVRDGVAIIGNAWNVLTPASTYVPVPGIHWIDQTAAPGAHNYAYQVMVPTGGVMIASTTTDGGFAAYEIG